MKLQNFSKTPWFVVVQMQGKQIIPSMTTLRSLFCICYPPEAAMGINTTWVCRGIEHLSSMFSLTYHRQTCNFVIFLVKDNNYFFAALKVQLMCCSKVGTIVYVMVWTLFKCPLGSQLGTTIQHGHQHWEVRLLWSLGGVVSVLGSFLVAFVCFNNLGPLALQHCWCLLFCCVCNLAQNFLDLHLHWGYLHEFVDSNFCVPGFPWHHTCDIN